MSIESTRQTMLRYFNSDHGALAEDVVFTVMASGQEHHGRQGVAALLKFLYHGAFEATAEARVTLYGDSNAMAEYDFVGKHIGEFAGVAATGKNVRVPLCVVYDLEGGLIKRGRVYFEVPAFRKQVMPG